MARLFQGERTFLHPVLRPVEALVYKLCGIREDAEQRWTQYAGGVLSFSVFAFLFVYVIQRLQGFLPLNPQGFGGKLVTPDLAYNTAISFMTNTNWQAYSGGVDAELFRPDGRAGGAELRLRGSRHRRRGGHDPRLCPAADGQRSGTSGSTSRARLSTSCCRSPSSRRCCCAPRAPFRTSIPTPPSRPSKGRPRPFRRARSLLRKPSRCWAPTAADSSTPTRRTPIENPTPFTNFIQVVPDLRDSGGADLYVRPHGRGYQARLGAFLAPWR